MTYIFQAVGKGKKVYEKVIKKKSKVDTIFDSISGTA